MEGNIDSVNNNRNTEVKDVSGETRDFDCGSEKSDNIQVKEEDDNSGLKKNASEGSLNNSRSTTPLSLNAIPHVESQVVKSSPQEVINMLLAQHGIIPVSSSLDVSTFTAQTSPTLQTANGGSENSQDDGPDTKDMVLPTMVHHAGTKHGHANDDSNASENDQTNDLHQNADQVEASTNYLSSIDGTDIVTTFVTEDGQGGHIIISGGGEYQDGSVVSMTGQQVSRVTERQLITIASGENAPVSIAALDNFGTDHVQIGTDADASDGGATTSYYVLEDHVAMVDGQTHLDANDQDVAKKVYQCTMDGCGKQFSTPYRLKAHGRSHTGQTFTCEEDGCEKTFITHSDLNKHSRTHTGDKPFFCDFENCGKVYSTAHHLKVHKRSHTGDKPFLCEWASCGKSFSTGYGLKSHFRTHTGERPYKCPEDACDKAFKTSGDLQKHIRTHTGERPFKCPYEGCTRSFTTSNIRKVHLRTHTGERPYVCEIEGCNRSFASATNYKNHSRIHTGERPYACEVPGCNKSFTEYSSLYKHNVVHTQQKPYICNICHKTYRQTSTLAMHKRTVHGAIDDSIAETENGEEDETSQEGEPLAKRQKVSYDSNVAITTALVQGLPLMLNDEGTMTALQTHYAELAAQQQISDGSALSGAIAIPIQVTMNPDGTIAGAHGINLTDSSGRIIPVSLSLSLPISSFANSMSTTNSDDSIATSEAAVAASAVHEIFSTQQSETDIDVQLTSGQVIADHIDDTDVIQQQSHDDSKVENESIIPSEGITSQILITTVADTHSLMTPSADSTTVRIAPRDYTGTESTLANITVSGKDDVSRTDSNPDSGGDSSMIIVTDVGHEQDDGDVTDRYLIKESDVKEKISLKSIDSAE